MSLLTLFQWYGFGGPKLSKTLNLEQWKQHINQGHKPYRRDCRTCVLNMARAKPHRCREGLGSSAWTMSVDLVHMPKTKDLATKRIVKYALVATALVPVMDSPPGDEGKDEKVPALVETVDGCWGEGLDEESFSLDAAPDGSGEIDGKEESAPPGVEGCESKSADDGYVPTTDEEGCDGNMGEQPPKAKGSGDDPKMEPLDPGNLLEREVRELSKPLKVRHVTLMEPVESRNVNQVISAMNLVLTKNAFPGGGSEPDTFRPC